VRQIAFDGDIIMEPSWASEEQQDEMIHQAYDAAQALLQEIHHPRNTGPEIGLRDLDNGYLGGKHA